MKIRNVLHKGLRRLIEDDDTAGLEPAVVPKLRRIVSFSPGHGAGGRVADSPELEGTSADRRPQERLELFVTKNWRITFRIDQAELEIIDLDYEDYH